MGVHINQFYSCSKIAYACELYYICELSKYLHTLFGESLSLDGVILVEDLPNSIVWDMFRIAVDKGWLTDVGIPAQEIEITIQNPLIMSEKNGLGLVNYILTEDEVAFDKEDYLKRQGDPVYDYTTPKLAQISFLQKQDDIWVWEIYGKSKQFFNVNNKTIGCKQSYMVLTSLVAYVAVLRLKTGVPKYFGCEFSGQVVVNGLSLSYLDILLDKTECFGYKNKLGNAYSWFNYQFNESVSEEKRNQLGYYAWYMHGKDKGYFSADVELRDKLAYIKDKDIRQGDFVMLYQREKQQRNNYMKSIKSCQLAYIKEMRKDGILFDVFHTYKPYYHAKTDFDDNTMDIKMLYRENKPYESLKHTEKFIPYIDMGIELLLFSEVYFIMRLSEVGEDGGIYAKVHNKTTEAELLITQNDLVYWICKDYDYSFDEERFLALNFPKSEPIYTRFMRGDTLEDCYYFKG